jgi:hypothetical protein
MFTPSTKKPCKLLIYRALSVALVTSSGFKPETS